MKNIVLFFFLLCLNWNAFSQEKAKAYEGKLRKFKITFIQESLALSPQDSLKFWEVYHVFDEERLNLRRKLSKLCKGFTARTDAQLKSDLDELIRLREQELNLEKKYMSKFMKILNIRQVAAFYQAEAAAKKMYIERFGHFKDETPPKNGQDD